MGRGSRRTAGGKQRERYDRRYSVILRQQTRRLVRCSQYQLPHQRGLLTGKVGAVSSLVPRLGARVGVTTLASTSTSAALLNRLALSGASPDQYWVFSLRSLRSFAAIPVFCLVLRGY